MLAVPELEFVDAVPNLLYLFCTYVSIAFVSLSQPQPSTYQYVVSTSATFRVQTIKLSSLLVMEVNFDSSIFMEKELDHFFI
jgi:hypothetical protein